MVICDSSMGIITNPSNSFSFPNGLSLKTSSCLEIRLFYVRTSPCVLDSLPDHLTLFHLRREIGVSMEINSSRIPASEKAHLTLRRDRIDKELSEVTYVSTDNVRVTGSVEFEVYENEGLVLCGSLDRMESNWSIGSDGLGNDSKTGWSMDCHMAMSINSGSSSFFQPHIGASAPSMEVYIAGCCSSRPVILTKTIQISTRRKCLRQNCLDAIPEDEELDKDHKTSEKSIRLRKLQIIRPEFDENESEGKVIGHHLYSEEGMYYEDGQLSWFNAGVRVGVGIGLGMCVGIGVGVGLLMRSYRTTTRNFRRFL